jgi:hypothetical protein
MSSVGARRRRGFSPELPRIIGSRPNQGGFSILVIFSRPAEQQVDQKPTYNNSKPRRRPLVCSACGAASREKKEKINREKASRGRKSRGGKLKISPPKKERKKAN